MESLRHLRYKRLLSPMRNTLNLKTDIKTFTNKLRTFEKFNNTNAVEEFNNTNG